MKNTDRESSRTDGGEEISVFDTRSDVSRTLSDKFQLWFDRKVTAPVRILLADWRGKIGLFLISLYLFMGTVGVAIYSEPSSDVPNRMVPSFQTLEYPLGTDQLGRGVLRMTIHSTPTMLKIVLAGGIFAIMVGTVIGMVSGYKGGLVDQGLMMITDTLMTLPGLPLVIVLAFLFEPRNPYMIGIILAINNWTGLARTVRSQMLPLRDIEYVESARSMGIPLRSIIKEDMLPNIAPYVAVNFVGASRRVIFESVGLYYLGILPTNSASNWGVMIRSAYQNGATVSLGVVMWLLTPMFAIIFLSLGMILLSQAADKLFNPRIKARHQKTVVTDEETSEPAEV